ncbi:Hydroperoxide isomerase aloxe3 [Chytridiales sp. JEL 0842]|nr:Hydroperoxide isomerase aloxe3 [Chytridiales sp. JEL 0842]
MASDDDDAKSSMSGRTSTSARGKGSQDLKRLFALVGIVYAVFAAIGLWQSLGKYEPVTSLDSFFLYYLAVMYIFSNTFLIFHHFVVQAFVKALNGYDNPEKTAMHCVYLFEGKIKNLGHVINDLVGLLVYRDDYIRFTVSGATVMATLQVYTVMAYTYEIAYIGSKKMSPMLRIHHITCITIQTIGVAMDKAHLGGKANSRVTEVVKDDDVTVENLNLSEDAEASPGDAAARSTGKRQASSKSRTLWFLIGIQAAGIVASILGVVLNRGPRVCDARYNDGLSLPQNDPDPFTRAVILRQRNEGFVHIQNEQMPFPPSMSGTMGTVYVNAIHGLFSKLFVPWSATLGEEVAQTEIMLAKEGFSKFTSLNDFEKIYKIVGVPAGHNPNALTDAYFGRAKVTWSPEYIQIVPSISSLPMNITNADVAGILQGLTLAELVQQKRLFYVDHSEFMIEVLRYQRSGTHSAAPKALYYVNDAGDLMPLAIQLYPNDIIFTPMDGWDWQLAKIALTAAEGARIGLIDHFVEVHFSTIPFVTSMNKMMVPSHPVFAMLDGILHRNLGIVATGSSTGLAPVYGALVTSLPIDANGTYAAISNRYQNWTFFDQDPNVALLARGIQHIPNNLYLKHIIPLYQASQDLYSDLVSIYYPDDASVVADPELQAFAADLTTEGRVKGFPTAFKTRAELAKALGHLHYICTSLHAVMNAYSLNFRGALPAAPLVLYKALPKVKGTVTAENILDWLPPLKNALMHIRLIKSFVRPMLDSESLPNMYVGFSLNSPKTRCALQAYRDKLRTISREVKKDAQAETVVPGWNIIDPYNIPNYSFI